MSCIYCSLCCIKLQNNAQFISCIVMLLDVQGMLAITWLMCSITALACRFATIVIKSWIPWEESFCWNPCLNSAPLRWIHCKGWWYLRRHLGSNAVVTVSFSLLWRGIMKNHYIAGSIIISCGRVIGVSLLVVLMVHRPVRSTHTWLCWELSIVVPLSFDELTFFACVGEL